MATVAVPCSVSIAQILEDTRMDINNEKLEILKNKAINLRDEIKQHKNIIDNPALCRSTVDELNFFIENIQGDY